MGDDGLFFNPLWTVFAERSVVPMAVGTATGCRAVLVGVSLLTTASAHWAPPTTVLLTVSKALAVEASHRVPDVRPYFQFKIRNLQRMGRLWSIKSEDPCVGKDFLTVPAHLDAPGMGHSLDFLHDFFFLASIQFSALDNSLGAVQASVRLHRNRDARESRRFQKIF